MPIIDSLPWIRQLVQEAGRDALRMQSSARVVREKDGGDLVTETDLFVEERLIATLSDQFPDYGFDSEERGCQNADAEYVWVIDPIDGTKHYAKDLPLYAISLALMRQGQPVLGVVYCPEWDRTYTASLGGGAAEDGAPIRCTSLDDLASAMICAEIPSRHSLTDVRDAGLARFSRLVEGAYRVRILGVGSIGLCLCAAGGFDAYVSLGSRPKLCDVAAGRIIVQEAGGVYLEMDDLIIAGPAALCQRLREVLES